MSFSPLEPRFSSAEASIAAKVSRGTFDAWLLRRYLPLPPGPGTGAVRRFSLLDVVRIAVVVQLNRLGIAVSQAANVVRPIEERHLKPHREGQKWVLVVAPTTTQSEGSEAPFGPVMIVAVREADKIESIINLRFSDPLAYVLVDLTRTTAAVIDELKL